MKIRYLGPSPAINVGMGGQNVRPHIKGKVLEYPKEIGEDLLLDESNNFEAVKEEKTQKIKDPASKTDGQTDIIEAARAAIAAGDVTGEGKPHVKAIEVILGRDITAKERDTAWDQIKAAEADNE